MPWSNAAITNAGIALQNKTVTGGTITLTAAKAGSGSVPVVNLRNQTELQSIKQTMQIKRVKVSGNTVTVELLVTTIGLLTSYNLQQIGIYATDPDDGEILYAIAQADQAQVMPTESQMPLYAITFCLSFALSQDLTMTAVIDTTSFATLDDLEDLEDEIDNEFSAYNIRVTALENINAANCRIFNTWTGCSNWTKIDYTKSINKGSVLLFSLHDSSDNTYYNTIALYYDNNTSCIQYFTTTKYIHIEWKSTSYCNVKIFGFTTGGLYRITQLLK